MRKEALIKPNLLAYGLFRLFEKAGCSVTLRVHSDGEEYLVAETPAGPFAYPAPEPERLGEWERSSAPVPGEGFAGDATGRLIDFIVSGFPAGPVDNARRFNFGHLMSEQEFRSNDERVVWLDQLLRSRFGQDLLAVLQSNSPAHRLGAAYGTSHRSAMAQVQITSGEEKRILGEIEAFSAVWDLLVRRLPSPLQVPARNQPRKRSSAAAPNQFRP